MHTFAHVCKQLSMGSRVIHICAHSDTIIRGIRVHACACMCAVCMKQEECEKLKYCKSFVLCTIEFTRDLLQYCNHVIEIGTRSLLPLGKYLEGRS